MGDEGIFIHVFFGGWSARRLRSFTIVIFPDGALKSVCLFPISSRKIQRIQPLHPGADDGGGGKNNYSDDTGDRSDGSTLGGSTICPESSELFGLVLL